LLVHDDSYTDVPTITQTKEIMAAARVLLGL
jgi:hypothetical protein